MHIRMFRENRKPKEGTKIRKIYDIFHENKGVPIPFTTYSDNYLRPLQDYYEMDIIKISQGIWCFAGEWKSNKYHDYIALKISEKSS